MSLHAVKEKGFGFTLEALISLMILVVILSVPLEEKQNDLTKIYSIQKENDLIKVWIKIKGLNEKEMQEDFRKMFPFQKGEITIQGKKILIDGQKGTNELKSSGFYFENGETREISVKVFV